MYPIYLLYFSEQLNNQNDFYNFYTFIKICLRIYMYYKLLMSLVYNNIKYFWLNVPNVKKFTMLVDINLYNVYFDTEFSKFIDILLSTYPP